MTLFEFFTSQLEKAKADKHFDECNKFYSDKYGADSFEWFKGMSKHYFGGGYLWRYKQAGVSMDEIREAHENKILKYDYDTSWMAHQLHQEDWYGLTAQKGLRAFYKYWKENRKD